MILRRSSDVYGERGNRTHTTLRSAPNTGYKPVAHATARTAILMESYRIREPRWQSACQIVR